MNNIINVFMVSLLATGSASAQNLTIEPVTRPQSPSVDRPAADDLQTQSGEAFAWCSEEENISISVDGEYVVLKCNAETSSNGTAANPSYFSVDMKRRPELAQAVISAVHYGTIEDRRLGIRYETRRMSLPDCNFCNPVKSVVWLTPGE